jgi:GDPmannose 4,6-dehydratase
MLGSNLPLPLHQNMAIAHARSLHNSLAREPAVANKTALITGITGQDGAYLSRVLLDKGYRVVGSMRRTSGIGTWRLQELQVLGDIEFMSMELTEESNVRTVLEKVKPDEIYNLAAQSFVGDSFTQPIYTAQVTGIGTLRLLESVRTVIPTAKFYQASTSEMFGKAQQVPQTEKTPFYPRSPYGIAKLFALGCRKLQRSVWVALLQRNPVQP